MKSFSLFSTLFFALFLISATVTKAQNKSGYFPIEDSKNREAALTTTDFTYVVSGTQVRFHVTNPAVIGQAQLVWDFGDGSFSSSPFPLHQYLREGRYVVTLTLINGNQQAQVSKMIRVGSDTPTPVDTRSFPTKL